MAANLIVNIVTDASKAVAGFKKVDQTATQTAEKTQSAGSKISGFAKAVATGYAVTKVVEFGKASIEAATESIVAQKRLEVAFKNAGDTTGEAAKHAEDYAEKLGLQIGVAPHVIEGAEGILAAFHAVSNEGARQAGIFDGATKAAADLAAAGFGDLTSNAKLLGKALTDPTKGMTVLRRSGVVLTQAQQDSIKAMQKQGNLLGAQKALLADVNKNVGGAAAATATAGAKMSVAFEEVKVKIGTALLPYVTKIKTTLLDVVNFVSANSGWLVPLVGGALAFVGAIKAISAAQKLWNDATKAGEAITKAWTAATKLATAANAALDVVLDADPIVLIILAIIAVVAAIVVLIIKVAAFRDFWKAVWRDVQGAIQAVWGWIRANWPLLLAILTGPIGVAVLLIVKNWNTIKAGVQSVWNWIRANWPTLLAILTGPVGIAALLIARNWDSIKSGAAAVWGYIRSAWSSIYGILTSPFVSAIGWIRGALDSLVGFIEGIPGAIGRALAGVYDAILGPFVSAFAWIKANILGPLKSVWNGVANTINSVHISTPEVKILNHTVIPAFHWSPPFHIPTLAAGGVINGPTLAMLGEAGREIVTPERLLRQIVGQGGTNININVNVPATADQAQVGRQVVNTLRAYVRANGPIPGIAS